MKCTHRKDTHTEVLKLIKEFNGHLELSLSNRDWDNDVELKINEDGYFLKFKVKSKVEQGEMKLIKEFELKLVEKETPCNCEDCKYPGC